VELTLLKVSVKVIRPVGVPLPELGVTVAVKVMTCPGTAEVAEATRLVVVEEGAPGVIVTSIEVEVLELKLVSPLYLATIV
jgi:hypothetical protein